MERRRREKDKFKHLEVPEEMVMASSVINFNKVAELSNKTTSYINFGGLK